MFVLSLFKRLINKRINKIPLVNSSRVKTNYNRANYALKSVIIISELTYWGKRFFQKPYLNICILLCVSLLRVIRHL